MLESLQSRETLWISTSKGLMPGYSSDNGVITTRCSRSNHWTYLRLRIDSPLMKSEVTSVGASIPSCSNTMEQNPSYANDGSGTMPTGSATAPGAIAVTSEPFSTYGTAGWFNVTLIKPGHHHRRRHLAWCPRGTHASGQYPSRMLRTWYPWKDRILLLR